MALPRPLLRLLRAAPSCRPASSCAPREQQPCPPCKPFPRPPCRSRGPEDMYAVQVTCCPPPRGAAPPCAPLLPACSMDCSQARPPPPKPRPATYVSSECKDEKCGAQRNLVVERLEAARSVRRADYLREVAERRAAPRPAPSAYHMPTPPALRAPDPCPRPNTSACGICDPTNKLQFRDPSGKVDLTPLTPYKETLECEKPSAGATGAKYAGDSAWCSMPTPAPGQAPCRPPSHHARLRERAPCRDLPCLVPQDAPKAPPMSQGDAGK